MAGTIHINESSIWTAGTVAFATIVDVTRHHFTDSEFESIDKAYVPLGQGFDFIVLEELDPKAFQLFCRKCDEACQECVRQKNCPNVPKELYEGVVDCWREFLDVLSKDDRFKVANDYADI